MADGIWKFHIETIIPSGGPTGAAFVSMSPQFHGDDGDHPGGPLQMVILNPDAMSKFVEGAVVSVSIAF
jgi:hypothetical protein